MRGVDDLAPADFVAAGIGKTPFVSVRVFAGRCTGKNDAFLGMKYMNPCDFVAHVAL